MKLFFTLLREPPDESFVDVAYASECGQYVIRDLRESDGYYEVYTPEGFIQRQSQDQARKFIEYLIGESVEVQPYSDVENVYFIDDFPVLDLPLERITKTQKAIEASFHSMARVERKQKSKRKYQVRKAREAPFREAYAWMKKRPGSTFGDWCNRAKDI